MELTPQFIRIISIIFGLGSGIYFVRSLVRQHALKHWPSTRGEILESKLEENSDGWYPYVRYSYSAQGKSYASDQLYFYSCNEAPAKRARTYLLPYPVGKAVTIYYNPRNPEEAVLDRRLPLWRPLFWLIFTSFFLAIGAGILA